MRDRSHRLLDELRERQRLFDELRAVFRLADPTRTPTPLIPPIARTEQLAVEQHFERYRTELRQRLQTSEDHMHQALQTLLDQLDRVGKQLFGHPILEDPHGRILRVAGSLHKLPNAFAALQPPPRQTLRPRPHQALIRGLRDIAQQLPLISSQTPQIQLSPTES